MVEERYSRRRFVLRGIGMLSVGACCLAGARQLRRQVWQDQQWSRRSAELVAEPLGEVLVLTDGARYRLNETGLFLWKQCDGRRTGAELAMALQRKWSLDPATANRDVGRFLRAMAEAGVVERQ